MKSPPAFAASDAGTVVTTCPFTWTTIGELGVNALPMTCTVLPAAAVDGLTWITGVATVKVALAEFPAASVIVSVFVALAVTGIVKVVAAWIAPVAFVVVVLRTTAAPLTFAVIALDAANPVPDTVISVPLLPVVGVTAIAGPTVIAFWTDRPVFKSCKVSRYVPAKRPVGTMNQVVFENAFAPVTGTVISPNWSTPPTG